MRSLPTAATALLAATPAIAIATASATAHADVGAPPAAAETMTAPPAAPRALPMFGVLADAGLPDGMNAAVVVRPWKWVRFQGGLGTNSVSLGYRGGVTLLPFGWGPSLSLEAGRYAAGDANGLVQRFAGADFERQALFEKVSYGYMNAHAGLDFGSKRFVFFIHGGVSRLSGTMQESGPGSAQANGGGSSGESEMDVSVGGKANIKAVGPSLKMGLIVYVL